MTDSPATTVTIRPTLRAIDATGDRSIAVPGDKSIAHRAGFFAGLARGTSLLHNFPLGRDNLATLNLMSALGARVSTVWRDDAAGNQTLRVEGFADRLPLSCDIAVDCLNSGTTARIGMGIIAGLPGAVVRLSGDASLSRRPMQRVRGPLAQMGADIRGDERGGDLRLPVTVRGGPLRPWSGTLPVASAQVKSALLMAGLVAGVDVEVREPGPSRDHTENFLHEFGYDVTVDRAAQRVHLRGTGLRHAGRELWVAGDPSSAAFWAAFAVATGGTVELRRITWNPTRTGFFDALRAMGAKVMVDGRHGDNPDDPCDVQVAGRVERGVVVAGDLAVRAIDELPLLALLGVLLPPGEFVEIRDAAELRVKETDRIAATAAIAQRFGGVVETGPDWIRVAGGRAPGTTIAVDSHHDHRMAMGAAVLAVATGRVTEIAHADAVAVSYPGFWREMKRQELAQLFGLGQ